LKSKTVQDRLRLTDILKLLLAPGTVTLFITHVQEAQAATPDSKTPKHIKTKIPEIKFNKIKIPIAKSYNPKKPNSFESTCHVWQL
jgi:hypothetical protein